MDRKCFNFQKTNEADAVFFTKADEEIPASYVTIHNKHTAALQCRVMPC